MGGGTDSITKADALRRVRGLRGDVRASTICGLVGHSRMQEYCWGYFSCGRCGAQLGDSLAGVYPQAGEVVVKGHACETCRENAKALTWRDKLGMPNPDVWLKGDE